MLFGHSPIPVDPRKDYNQVVNLLMSCGKCFDICSFGTRLGDVAVTEDHLTLGVSNSFVNFQTVVLVSRDSTQFDFFLIH